MQGQLVVSLAVGCVAVLGVAAAMILMAVRPQEASGTPRPPPVSGRAPKMPLKSSQPFILGLVDTVIDLLNGGLWKGMCYLAGLDPYKLYNRGRVVSASCTDIPCNVVPDTGGAFTYNNGTGSCPCADGWHEAGFFCVKTTSSFPFVDTATCDCSPGDYYVSTGVGGYCVPKCEVDKFTYPLPHNYKPTQDELCMANLGPVNWCNIPLQECGAYGAFWDINPGLIEGLSKISFYRAPNPAPDGPSAGVDAELDKANNVVVVTVTAKDADVKYSGGTVTYGVCTGIESNCRIPQRVDPEEWFQPSDLFERITQDITTVECLLDAVIKIRFPVTIIPDNSIICGYSVKMSKPTVSVESVRAHSFDFANAGLNFVFNVIGNITDALVNDISDEMEDKVKDMDLTGMMRSYVSNIPDIVIFTDCPPPPPLPKQESMPFKISFQGGDMQAPLYLSVKDGQVQQYPLNLDGTVTQTWVQDTQGRIVKCYDKSTGIRVEPHSVSGLFDVPYLTMDSADNSAVWRNLYLDFWSQLTGYSNFNVPQTIVHDSDGLNVSFQVMAGMQPEAGAPFYLSDWGPKFVAYQDIMPCLPPQPPPPPPPTPPAGTRARMFILGTVNNTTPENAQTFLSVVDGVLQTAPQGTGDQMWIIDNDNQYIILDKGEWNYAIGIPDGGYVDNGVVLGLVDKSAALQLYVGQGSIGAHVWTYYGDGSQQYFVGITPPLSTTYPNLFKLDATRAFDFAIVPY